MALYNNIAEYIKVQETAYEFPIQVIEGWEWGMKNHIKLTTLYKNSQFETGKEDFKPFKNIMLPILRLQYRTEGFDVKDIELFVNDSAIYYKSFLIKKFHEKWARDNQIDAFIDELVESYVDYGGALVKKTKNMKPEVVPWQSVAFCDQTDILSGPIAIKHFFSPDQLRDMEGAGWGLEENGADVSIEDLIVLSEDKKVRDKVNGYIENKTPGQYVEIYEIHGTLQEDLLGEGESNRYVPQLHIVAMYKDFKDAKQYRTLFKKRENQRPFKVILRDGIFGRALGLGGAEELFESQVWTNYDQIRIQNMLDAAAKIIYKTTDPNFANRNKMSEVDNEEILTLEEGRDIAQIDNSPRNVALFERSIGEWEELSRSIGSAGDPLMGNRLPSHTPFRLVERLVTEGKGIHEYRRGKLATFVDEIYKDWILPHIIKEITGGQEFLANLKPDELHRVTDSIVENKANRFENEEVLSGRLLRPGQKDVFKERARREFLKGGSKRYLKILKNELKSAPIDVVIDVGGKQKDLSSMIDSLTNVFRQVISAPQVLDDPRIADLFNKILEYSGFSPIQYSFSRPETSPPSPVSPPANLAGPVKNLALAPA